MSKRPGFMLYFDMAKAFNMLSPLERGNLISAIFEYAELGVVPDLEGMAAMAWTFIQPRLDLDREHYDEKVRGSQYGVYKREALKRKENPLDREKWEEEICGHKSTSPDLSNSNSASNGNSATTTNSTTTAGGTTNKNADGTGGAGGEPSEDPEFVSNRKRNEAFRKLDEYRANHSSFRRD